MGKNNIRRNLDESALHEALLELNADFLSELPDTPENLFKYASRRVEPEISSNISYDLGRKMLDYRLSDKDYFITFLKIVRYVFNGKEPSESPKSNVLLSQTGAGKSNLRELILRKNPKSVIIDSDKFKKFRADANDIFEEDAPHFGALTGIDSYDHAYNINTYAMEKGYDILIECAPSISQGMIGVDIDMMKKYSYDICYHALAVGNLISSFSIHKRYENDIRDEKMKGEAKLTDLGRHNDSYNAMTTIIKTIDPNKLSLYRRGTKDENYVPVLVNASNKAEKFKKLQFDSNVLYSREQQLSDMSDYNEIKKQMEERNASPMQFEQLEKVKNDFLLFCLKNQKETQVLNDSLEL